MDADAIQAAKRLTTEGHYNYWEGIYSPNAMEDAEVLASAYLALVAKVRELRAAQSEDFVERLVDLYMAAGIKE